MNEKLVMGMINCHTSFKDKLFHDGILCYKPSQNETLPGVKDFKELLTEELDVLKSLEKDVKMRLRLVHSVAEQERALLVKYPGIPDYRDLLYAIQEYEDILNEYDTYDPGLYHVEYHLSYHDYFIQFEKIEYEYTDLYQAEFKDGKWTSSLIKDSAVKTSMFGKTIFILFVDTGTILFSNQKKNPDETEWYMSYKSKILYQVNPAFQSYQCTYALCHKDTQKRMTKASMGNADWIDEDLFYNPNHIDETDARNTLMFVEPEILEYENKSGKWHTCKDCGNPFVLSKTEKEWFKKKNFSLPKRCFRCRNKRKAEKEELETE